MANKDCTGPDKYQELSFKLNTLVLNISCTDIICIAICFKGVHFLSFVSVLKLNMRVLKVLIFFQF